MKPLSPNSMIQNRYLVVHAIGKGGMGEVYLSVDQRLGSAVALKRTFFTEDNTLAAAFEREARILARLRHPVLPKVIDHFVENGDQYLVMEHISGDDLSKRLESAGKPFPLSWVMFWADQLLDALSYLHSHEPPIIHRDIKPQNLKLTDENHIVLLDFGLSKDFDTKSTSNPLNSASVAGYSPHFASMEQIRGTGTDSRSDIYSLSATLYQLMADRIPVDALSRADALLGGKPDPIVPINEINPEVTPAISEVILKGIALRQEDRYLTAAEMQKALRRAFDRGKKEPDAVRSAAIPDTPHTSAAGTPLDSQPSEMETRALSDTGKLAMDETVQMNELPAVGEFRQSEVKTEVIPAPEIQEVETKLASAAPAAQPQASSIEPSPMAAAAAAGSALPGPASAANTGTPNLPPVSKARGGSSKTGFIIGGLIGLLILAGIVGGGGWYLYKNSQSAKATPTPLPAPSVQPTAPVIVETAPITNPVSTPANMELTDANKDQVGKDESTTGTETTTKATTPGSASRAQPVKTPQAPAVKATPKPKAKDDRTVIIQ